MPDVETRRPTEWREQLRAAGRFTLLALQPWPLRWSRMADFMIAIAGAAAAVIIGFVEQSPLLGTVVFLAVGTALLLFAGTRVDRELHGDPGIQLKPRIVGELIELGVTNGSGKPADFGGSVEAVEPLPDKYPPSWPIPWATSTEERQTIDPLSTRYLRLGQGELSRRSVDR